MWKSEDHEAGAGAPNFENRTWGKLGPFRRLLNVPSVPTFCRNDNLTSTISLLRKSESAKDTVLIVCNFTPIPRLGYRVGVPTAGYWRELLNSDALEYGGTGAGNLGGVHADAEPAHGRPHSLKLTLPPLSALFLKVG